MIARVLLALGLAISLTACGHREVRAPCGPLAFAAENRLVPAAHPLRAFDREADCREAKPVNPDQSFGAFGS